MKMKKTVKMLAASVLAISMLAGCGAPATDAPESKKPESKVESKVEDLKAPLQTAPLKVHFHSNNKYTLNNTDGKLKPVYQLSSDSTGILIESTANPVAEKSEQEFELQAAEQFPSDIYGGNNIRNRVYTYAEQGAFLPLEDLIAEYAPNIKAYLDENPDVVKSLTSPDGHIYMIPYIPDGTVARTWWIRQDWLDALGLEVPTTVEEFEAVLYAFLNDDPNGNGQKDEIPLFNDKFEEIFRTANLWGARVYGTDSFKERVVIGEDDKMYHAWIHDDFKYAITQLARWYKDGIIDNEVFTRKANTARQTLWSKENRGGVTHEWLASTSTYNANVELLASIPDFKVTSFLPVSFNGKEGYEEHHRTLVKPDGWAISAKTTQPEISMMWIDWFFSPDGKTAANFGIEGESYTMVNGKPQFTDEVLSTGTVNQYLWDNFGAQNPIGFPQDYEYESQWTNEEGQKAFDLYFNEANFWPETPIMTFTSDEIAIQDQYITGLNTYMDETVQGMIEGKFDVEAYWDTYVAKCKELGVDELVAVYESAYERYKNS